MPKPKLFRLVLLEASKVRNQHSTVVDGILRAHAHGGLAALSGGPVVYAHETLFASLSPEALAGVEFHAIPVMDPERRRLVRKSLLEAFIVLRAILRLKAHSEMLLVTTLLPSAGILVEIVKWFFPHKTVVVMLHGELEGVLERERQGIGSFGYYVRLWFALRRFHSRLDLAVIDSFIGRGIADSFPHAVSAESLFVVPLLVAPFEADAAPAGRMKCCFIGYDTPHKGLSIFRDLAATLSNLEFRTVGAGYVRNSSGAILTRLETNHAYFEAIASCDIAIFPYTGGYYFSLSAAATDAIAAGLHLLAFDRSCFQALHEGFGDDCVTICRDIEHMRSLLADTAWLAKIRGERTRRVSRLGDSRYGLEGVAGAVRNLLEPRTAMGQRTFQGSAEE